MEAPRQSFGDLLRQHRLAAGVSQEELAEHARLSVQTISALERGARQRPYRETIAMLADALGLSKDARTELERAAARRSVPLAAGPPPSDVLTFLFSTIEGGLSRWESRPEAMADAAGRHNEVMRSAIEAHGGFIFRTVGEDFCAVFEHAEDAAAAATDALRLLRSADFRAVDGLSVRMALHAGRADVHHGEYVGPAAGRTARLLEVAHGGQILVSAAAHALLRDTVPEDVTLGDLGPHRLRDLARSEHVYQLGTLGSDAVFPPIRSLEVLPNNLPTQLSSFVGREDDVAEIERLIARHRLVTLVGTGGVGKTRTALHVAADLLDGSGQGVWFVDFAPLTDASLLENTIASALHLRAAADRPVLETLIAFLKNKHLLLILDNCEHLIESAARVAEAILQACPRVSILATSREALAIGGERTYRLPSLSVPPADELRTLTVEEGQRYGAIALFATRAEAADHRFVLTEHLLPTVAEICRRLDGIALAIELAAARVNVLSAETLANRLNERFLILTGGSRTALPRHKTMRALLDWSYDLLEDREQRVLRKLSVFAGGFTLELATAVCAGEGISEADVLVCLVSLVEKSLVQTEAGRETTRYSLLESTKQYAGEKLRDRGEHGATACAHAAALLALAERFDSTSELIPDRVWTAQVKPELENWRAALEWTLGGEGELSVGQRLAGSLGEVWRYQPAEGRRWLDAAWKTCDEATPPRVRARLQLAESIMLFDYEAAVAAAERAMLLYDQADDPAGVAQAQYHAGQSLIFCRNLVKGERLVRAAREFALSHGARGIIGRTSHALAMARYFANDVRAARDLYREALALFKASGCERYAGRVALNLAEVEFHLGEVGTALRLSHEAMETLRLERDAAGQGGALCNRSAYLTSLNRFEEARDSASEALVQVRDARSDAHIRWALQHLAAIAALRPADHPADRRADLRRAARVLGFADARFLEHEPERQYTEQQEYDKMLPVLRDELGADLDALLREGAQWSEDQAVAEALTIEAREAPRPSTSLG